MGRRQRRRVIGACPFADNDEIINFGQTAAHSFSKKRVVVHNRYRNGCQPASPFAMSIDWLFGGHGKALEIVQRGIAGATEHF